MSVELKVADPDVLLRGLKAAGYRAITVSGGVLYATTPGGQIFTIDGGRVEIAGYSVSKADVQAVAAGIVKAYAAEAVQTVAKKYGWNVKTNTTTQQRTLTKRSF